MDDLAPRPGRVTADRDRDLTTVTGPGEPAARTGPDPGHLAGYRDLVIALSRRNQSLVQRQLQLVAEAEHGGQDALALLGILAARIRHNNENLMVLSGTEPGRSVQPVTTRDLLREAVSTEEQQDRIEVGTPPSARVVGQAAGDLIRLLAELLDNATSFSAPETPVTVGIRVFDGGGLVIDIADRGLGMGAAEIAAANALLAGTDPAGPPTPHQVGLRVTGALAARHAIAVAVSAEPDATGVRVSVTVPPALVTDLAETVPIRVPVRVPDPGPGVPTVTSAAAVASAAVDDPGLPGSPAELAAYLGLTDQGGGGELEQSWPPELPQGEIGWADSAPGAELPELTEYSEYTEHSRLGPDHIGTLTESGWHLPEPEAEVGAPPETNESGTNSRTDSGTESGTESGRESDSGSSTESDPVEEWWTAETTPDSPATPETTPIFDEMVSAWFRDEPEEPADQPATPTLRPAPAAGWAFEADAGWRTVQEVTRSAPSSYTEVGLPRRRRGEQLMPGGIAAGAGRFAPPAESGSRRSARDADGVRGRLSKFQRGVRRARDDSREQLAPVIADPAPPRDARPAAEPPAPAPAPAPAWSFPAEETRPAIAEIAHPEPEPAPSKRVRRGRHRLADEDDPDAGRGA